jgi:hypothetical protein
MSIVEGLHEETLLFGQSMATDPAKARMKRFMDLGGQTRDVELDLHKMINALSDSVA